MANQETKKYGLRAVCLWCDYRTEQEVLFKEACALLKNCPECGSALIQGEWTDFGAEARKEDLF